MALDERSLVGLYERIPAKETVRGFVFNAIVAHVADKKGAVVASGLQERLMRKRPSDLLSYPATDFFKLLHASAVALQDPAGIESAVHALGYASAIGFFNSPMGKLLLGIVGRGYPARLMSNCPTAYATSFSFGKREYTRVSDNELRLAHQADFLPVAYNVGAMEAALAAAEAKAKVSVVDAGPDRATYVLTW